MFRNINEIIKKVSELINKYPIVCLTGERGSGKTYFVRNYMQSIYGFDDVTSPTYTTCNTYVTHNGHIVKHFDFDIKCNEHEMLIAFETADLIFIEWWYKCYDVINEYNAGNAIEVNCETENINILRLRF